MTLDRAGFKPPEREDRPGFTTGSRLHWDWDRPRGRAAPRALQGVLHLTDAPPGGGCFACVPGLYRDLDAWLAAHAGEPLPDPASAGYPVVEVPARAGDLVIWDQRLAHDNTPNRGRAPRVVQYVSMFPEGADAEREGRVACWRERRAPPSMRGWPGQPDPEPWGEPARLTALGRRLLGADRW